MVRVVAVTRARCSFKSGIQIMVPLCYKKLGNWPPITQRLMRRSRVCFKALSLTVLAHNTNVSDGRN